MSFEREIERRRAELLRVERNGASEIARSYKVVLERLNADLSRVTERIADARRRGEPVNVSWLFAEERTRDLIAQLESHLLAFLHRAIGAVGGAKAGSVELAQDAAPQLALAAIGAGPEEGAAMVLGSFKRLPARELDLMIANAGDGAPLGRLFAEIAPGSVQGVRDALSYGVASGRPVREIAREVRRQSGVALSRALTISRTEVLRVYREVSTSMYDDSRVVRGWTWWSALDSRTCPVCWAMHGTPHRAGDQMYSHVMCRCVQVPRTYSWAELGVDAPDLRSSIERGALRFERLSEGDKLAVLGRARLDAYNAGEINLEDLVRRTASPRWGPGLRQANLRELSLT